MNTSHTKNKILGQIIPGVLLVLTVVFYGIFIPFLLALGLVFWLEPYLQRFNKYLKNWSLSASLFLVVASAILVGFVALSGQLIATDIDRFSASFKLLWEENRSDLDEGAQQVQAWAQDLLGQQAWYQKAEKELSDLQSSTDTSSFELSQLGDSFDKLKDLWSKDSTAESKTWQWPQFGFWFQFSSFLLYFVLILFQAPYFMALQKRYAQKTELSQWRQLYQDFEQSFLRYFRLRTSIILWLMPLYLTAFALLQLPGAFVYLILIFFLLYIPYLQYLSLIPIALSALVLSTEIRLSYFWILGIIILVFIIASLLEELVLIPRIMERNIGLNPVIMVLGLSFWTYLLGTIGILIGIPLTSLAVIYLKRYYLRSD